MKINKTMHSNPDSLLFIEDNWNNNKKAGRWKTKEQSKNIIRLSKCSMVETSRKMRQQRKCSSYRSVGADGGEGIGTTGKQPVPVHQQHPDVVLALLLWKHSSKHTAVPLSIHWRAAALFRGTKLHFLPINETNTCNHGRTSLQRGQAWQSQIKANVHTA